MTRPIVVALSGGKDSTAMALRLFETEPSEGCWPTTHVRSGAMPRVQFVKSKRRGKSR